MADFMARFLVCNVFLSGIILFLLLVKRALRKCITSRMQYNLCFPMLGLLIVPFLPPHFTVFLDDLSGFMADFMNSFMTGSMTGIMTGLLAGLKELFYAPLAGTGRTAGSGTGEGLPSPAILLNDFTLSVSRGMPPFAGFLFFGIWLAGFLAMARFAVKSKRRFRKIKKSSLPLQNREARILYQSCLKELKIKRGIPVYSTAFLKSPVMAGLFRPAIYLPIHLLSDFRPADMRYILLHELVHYKYKDALINCLANLAGMAYWFNPFVWAMRREMRTDREVACDASVLAVLEEKEYVDYGNSLIQFAEKISLSPFPFAAGMGSSMRQMKRRIASIASYEPPAVRKRACGVACFLVAAISFAALTPVLGACAAGEDSYLWDTSSENVAYIDLSAYFDGYDGCFVLYDAGRDAWEIYHAEHAAKRLSPDSTYKIYDALLGLESGLIAPGSSRMPWDGQEYPFDAWNGDQTLESAMQNSVNWYFQRIDNELGISEITSFLGSIGYGNKNAAGGVSDYWLESSLKISPVEQVELLRNLFDGKLGFSSENTAAVKNAIFLADSEYGKLYGKTGTGRVNGKDTNGWFIGFIETSDHVSFFATNIQASQNAAGSAAAEITMSVLSDMAGE